METMTREMLHKMLLDLQFEIGFQRSLITLDVKLVHALEGAVKQLQVVEDRVDRLEADRAAADELLAERDRLYNELCETGADRCPVRE